MSIVSDFAELLKTNEFVLSLRMQPLSILPRNTTSTTLAPVNSPGTLPPLPAASGPDLSTNGLQSVAWANTLDGTGPYDFADVLPLGLQFAYVSEIPGFPRTGWSQKWTGYITPPVDGDYPFSGIVKSGGYLKVNGVVIAEQDREADPGNHDQWKFTVTVKGLKAGIPVPFEVFYSNQSNEHVCLYFWQPPGAAAQELIPRTALNPPVGWVRKAYVPPVTTTLAPVAPVVTPNIPKQPDPATYVSPSLQGVTFFKADSPWNMDISGAPIDPSSDALIKLLGNAGLHPGFGGLPWAGALNGIPYMVVDSSTPKVSVSFEIASESDPGPYPIPALPVLETGGNVNAGDVHLLLYHKDERKLYELYNVQWSADGKVSAYSGAIWDATINSARPAGWTSADAAGLPILPGLVRYDEVESGTINHALRFTAVQTAKAYVAPALHFASSRVIDPSKVPIAYPPMGTRYRLKASFDLSKFSGHALVILTALKRYGMFLADNGANMFLSGAPDSRFNDDALAALKQVPAGAFEVIQLPPITLG